MRSWTDDELRSAVCAAGSRTGVVRALGLRPAGGHHVSVRAHVERLRLDTSHFSATRRTPGVLAYHAGRRLGPADVFCVRGPVNRTTLRVPARGEARPHACALCGNPGAYRGLPLSLQLDHVNRVADDNRLENLRWLCPNCHSQTDTYCGRGARRRSPRAAAPPPPALTH